MSLSQVPTCSPSAASARRSLSQRLIDSHYEDNYGGAVRRTERHRSPTSPPLGSSDGANSPLLNGRGSASD